MRGVAMALIAVSVLGACEQTSSSLVPTPGPAQLLLAVPDSSFRLSAMEKAGLSPAIDPDALERLLARVRPEHRGKLLSDLNELGSGGPIAFGPTVTSIPDAEFRAAVQGIFRNPPSGRTPRQ